MPGTPPTSPVFGAPRYSDADTASFSSQLNGVTDVFDANAVKTTDARLTDQRVPEDGSVTAAKLAAGAVGTPALAAGAVTGAKIAAATIAESNLEANSVGTNELQAGAVTNPKLGAAAVGTGALADGAVTTPKLADSSTVLQPGDLIPSAASSRAGCLLCDGSAVSRTTYSALFAAIGTTYGAGDGSSTFNIPDFRSRFIIGAGFGPGLSIRVRGGKGGEETHTLAVGEMPVHDHPPVAGNAFGIVQPGLNYTWGFSSGGAYFVPIAENGSTGSAGGGDAHNNMPPYGVANVFVKY